MSAPETMPATASTTDNIQHLTECPGCERCELLMDFYLACDGCGEWGHKDSAHGYVMREGEVICQRCQALELSARATA